jgi:alkaline phosphatase
MVADGAAAATGAATGVRAAMTASARDDGRRLMLIVAG